MHAASLKVKLNAVKLGIHRELRLDSVLTKPYTPDEVARIEMFAEELANEKITGALYVMGVPYAQEHIKSTVYAMTVDPVAYSVKKLDDIRRHGNKKPISAYRSEATAIVNRLLASERSVSDVEICTYAGISQVDLDSARRVMDEINGSKDMLSKMMVMGSMMSAAPASTLKVSERKSPKKHHGMIPGMSAEKALEMARKNGRRRGRTKENGSCHEAQECGSKRW